MPFFAYYKTNNEEYQLTKEYEHLNKTNIRYKNTTRYRATENTFANKVSLDREMITIINAIESYVNKVNFPLKEMKKTSKNMIVELGDIILREVSFDVEEYRMQRNACLQSIKSINDTIENSPLLRKKLAENSIFDINAELTSEEKKEIDKLRFTLGIVINIFLLSHQIKFDFELNELDNFPYFTAYYLLGYELANKNETPYPMISNEMYLYLNWKIYKTDKFLFIEKLLESIEQQISQFHMEKVDEIINKLFTTVLLPLTKKECRLACVDYIKQCDKTRYSLELYAILESLPMQWS